MYSGHQNLILQRVNAEAWDFLGGVQWIKLCTSNVGGVGSVPGLGTKIHMQCGMARKLKKENDGKRGNKCLSSNYAIYTLKNCV